MEKNYSLNELLSMIDYSEDPDYQPSAFALEFLAFIKMVHADFPTENKSPVNHMKFLDTLISAEGDIINLCHRGFAKALALDTPLFTPEGITTIRDIKVGDEVLGEDGTPTLVRAKSEVFNKPMYRIGLENGDSLDVCEDHLNTIIHRRQKRVDGRRVNYLDRRIVTTKELLKIPLTASRKATSKNPKGQENRVWLPLPEPIQHTSKEFCLDPYTLGVLLGDGCIDRKSGYSRVIGHVNDIDYILDKIPYSLGVRYAKENCVLQGILKIGKFVKRLGINVHGNDKFIPEQYFYGDIAQRTELLKGLMDTDGTVSTSGNCSYTSNSYALAQGVKRLVHSLGGMASVSEMNEAYRVNIRINKIIFNLPRKVERQHTKFINRIVLTSIERIGDKPSQCIAVSNSTKTFVAGNYTVTHNSTVFEYLILYLAVYGGVLPNFGRARFILYISDTIDNGVKKMKEGLEYKYQNSGFLQTYLKAKFTIDRWVFKNADGEDFICGGYGAATGVRGTRELGERPSIALLDDLMSDEVANSPAAMKKLEEVINGAIDFALHPTRRKVIWSGTPFNSKDAIVKAVESGAYTVNVFPVCEKFPCEESEFRGSWADRFPYYAIKRAYEKAKKVGTVSNFNRELMLRVITDDDRLILDEDIMYYDRSTLMSVKDNFNFYITTDFATSEKQSADYSVLSVWAYNNNGDWFFVDGVCKRQTMDANINDLFRLAQEYNPQSVGIEVSGQQGGFIPWIKGEMLTRNIFFPLASQNNSGQEGIRPNTNKFQRFSTVVPLFKARKVYMPMGMESDPWVHECLDELSLISPEGFKSRHDDVVDTISMLSLLPACKPSTAPPITSKGKYWEVERYNDVDYGYDSYME